MDANSAEAYRSSSARNASNSRTNFCPRGLVGKQRMVLAIKGHKSDIWNRAREAPARVERNKPIVDGVKDDRGHAHLRQQVDDVDIIDSRPQIYRGSPVECPDTLKLDK